MTFPCYPKYKASGFLWLGDVPELWTLKRLGHYFEERRERASDTEFEPLSVTKNGIVPRLESAAKTQDGDNRKKVLAGDFVINSRSDRKGSSGLSPLDGSVSLICTVLIPTELHGPYIHHLFRSELFQEEYYRWGKGIVADLWSTNFSDMKNIVLGVPSEEEQAQIARFLDHETARIDALIEEQQRLIELLKEKRQAVISHAVTKGLDPTVPMKDSGEEWLGEVPAHWDVLNFNLLVYIAEGQVNPKLQPYSDMLLIAPNHVESATGRLLYLETAEEQGADSGKYLCQEGDVVYSKIRPALRKVCVAPKACLCSADMYPMRGHSGLENRYLFWFILSEPFSAFALLESDRVAMPKINRESLGGLKLARPPAEEQRSIAAFLNQEAQQVDALIDEALSGVGLLNERRSALISAAVTGKIDVRGWQPPARAQAPELVQEAV